MGSRSLGGPRPGGGPPAPRRDTLLLAVIWGRVVVGLGMAGTAGLAFGHAWTKEYAPMWWVGGISLCAGVLLVLSGLHARSDAIKLSAETALTTRTSPTGEPLVPLLGALLIYKYQLITHKQLADALAQQRKSKALLGQILLGMALITEAQLEAALEHQRSYIAERHAADGRGVWPTKGQIP